jgi:hypothetical protein
MFQMKIDGSDSLQLTHGPTRSCSCFPALSPWTDGVGDGGEMQHIKCYGLLMWKLCIVQAFRNEVGILIHMNVYVHYDTCVIDIMRVLLFVDSAGETSESCTEMPQAVFGKADIHHISCHLVCL